MSRTLAREAAFKALFQLDFNFEEAEREACENLAVETMYDDEPRLTSKKDFAFIEAAVKGTRAHLAQIDELIVTHLKQGWQLSRLMAADRNILRLAVYEMKFAAPEEYRHKRGGRTCEEIRHGRFGTIRKRNT